MSKRGKARKSKNKQANKKANQLNLQQLQAKLSPKVFNDLQIKSKSDWQKAPLSHHTVFNNFMDDQKMCQGIFKAILKNFNVNLQKLSIATEKTFEGKGKGARLDLVAEDINNIINLEMQRKIKYMPPKRIRNYFVIIDKDQLSKGQEHTELKNTYIIVVTQEDPFGDGEPIYIIDKKAVPMTITKFEDGEFNINDYAEDNFDLAKAKKNYSSKEKSVKTISDDEETKNKKTTEYRDGTYIIYLNASAYKKVENEILKVFLAYVMEEHLTEIDFFYVIHERFKKVKNDKKMEASYMLAKIRDYYHDLELRDNIIEEYRKEVFDEFYQKEVNMVLKMINQNCDDEFIKNVTDFTLEEIAKIREEHSNQ